MTAQIGQNWKFKFTQINQTKIYLLKQVVQTAARMIKVHFAPHFFLVERDRFKNRNYGQKTKRKNKMNFKLKQNLLVLTTLVIIATLIGCASTGSETTETKPGKTTDKSVGGSETKTAEKTTIDEKTGKTQTTTAENNTNSTAPNADLVGVPECDDYIAKYEACLKGKVPEAARGALESSIAQMRQSWKQVAANPQARTALAGGCKQARETSKQSMAAYSCEW